MSVSVLKQTLEGVLGRNLSLPQVARIASAFYTKQDDQTNDEAASIVLDKLRRYIVERVKTKEEDEAAQQARESARGDLDDEFGTFTANRRRN